MIDQRIIDKFVKNLFRRYKSTYGDSIARLPDWIITPTSIAEDYTLLNIFFEFGEGLEDHQRLELILDELSQRGYIRKVDKISYCLTEAAVRHAKLGKIDKFVEFFNVNPGINTLIAGLALLVSCVALYITVTKP
ncbi:hypothetical protein [Shewanella sp. Arc9-LZ]|jgi:hypothetical protein|uniref:hypothetical protein n=1 Tax=Shewanella sp. Arc9-LZ TaxID=2698686 RepID=UPI00137C0184|nr:hypothetical protein [Shewanella sp. Arc9-LZ]QHS14136.1 hypothetical protein GUY17_13930 [Shewanella sp. Arc9-LZ]